MAFRGVQTFYSAVIARLNMLDAADREQRYSAINLYKTISVYTNLYKPINRDITYDGNMELRFDAKRQIETFEALKKSLVRGYFGKCRELPCDVDCKAVAGGRHGNTSDFLAK